MNKPVLALDFDGVIHRYSKGWQSGEIYDPPTIGFLEWLGEAQKHFTIIIHSSRFKDAGAVSEVSAWLADHAAKWRAMNERPLALNVAFSTKKPAAFVTIDDRAITFTGDWSKLRPEHLLRFKPWNQGGNIDLWMARANADDNEDDVTQIRPYAMDNPIASAPEPEPPIHKQPPYKPPPGKV